MKNKVKGEKLAMLFYLLFTGECGAFGREDPILKGNCLGLYSQSGTTYYIFNDDGSIRVYWDENAIRDLESQGINPAEDLPFIYDSLEDLLNSDDLWWYELSMNLTVRDLLKRILNNER